MRIPLNLCDSFYLLYPFPLLNSPAERPLYRVGSDFSEGQPRPRPRAHVQNAAPCPFSCNHYSCRTSWMDMGHRRIYRMPPRVPFLATITVVAPVGWTWDIGACTERRPVSLFLQPLQLSHQLDGHGT
ncbi:hypothetical protein AVEN_95130-1 [Araneus ventricosus]|uniref:Uncharacterized protein n=1 Tax=Araneus ventricosus TaxID=182803 RepID=A0A4Y2V2S4_ARAVE|nr:hypothetical protein AVEN_95130-1 [Araneus ventricosus]